MAEVQPTKTQHHEVAEELLTSTRALREVVLDAQRAVVRYLRVAGDVTGLDAPSAETMAGLAQWAQELFPDPVEFDQHFVPAAQAIAARLRMVGEDPERFGVSDPD